MTKNKRAIFLIFLILILLSALGICVYRTIYTPLDVDGTTYIYIDKDDDIDSVRYKVNEIGCANMMFFDLCNALSHYKENIHTGRYSVSSEINTLDLFLKLRNHSTEPVMLVVPSVRTMPEMAGRLSKQLMIDSVSLARAFTDSIWCESLGYTIQTIPALFIPDSYEMYWDVSLERLKTRLKQVNQEFWNSSRQKKAKEIGFTQTEVCTLASIIDSETSANQEKPIIAGLYINRLRKGMLLQSDPTVIFAIGDYSIRRVLKAHLQEDSPYNTYKYQGLPPGPIRVASIAGIDAVLNYNINDYLFMCAKEDFSGTHNFAVNSKEHSANARKYQLALNKKGIKK